MKRLSIKQVARNDSVPRQASSVRARRLSAALASPVPRHGRPVALALPSNRVERAARYFAAVPPAVASQHGDLRTCQVCCRLTRGFALSDDEAFALLGPHGESTSGSSRSRYRIRVLADDGSVAWP